MKKQDVKKIKTLLDFEETDKDFEEALADLDNQSSVEHLTVEVDIKIKDDDMPDEDDEHFALVVKPWTDDQINDFADMVWDTAEEICHLLIGKNIKYNSAYWWVRKACEIRYGDPTIPYFVHSYEKALRSTTDGDNEDAKLDRLGYEFLEYVCQKLEEKWKTDAKSDTEETEKTARGIENVSEAEDLIEYIPVKSVKLCLNCEEPLTGKHRKYCNSKCRESFRNKATKEKCDRLLSEEA